MIHFCLQQFGTEEVSLFCGQNTVRNSVLLAEKQTGLDFTGSAKKTKEAPKARLSCSRTFFHIFNELF
jgi:hypothetical protein